MNVVPRGRQILRARAAGLFVVLAVFAGVSSGIASPAPDYATQVGYFTAPVDGSMNWLLQCVADDPSIKSTHAIADGVVGPFGLSGAIFSYPRYSEGGRYVQVGNDHVLTYEDRETKDTLESSSTFNAGGSGGAPSGLGYVVFALWASTARCTGSINGNDRPITYVDGSHAYLVGPESFGTGILVQDGGNLVSAARTYTTGLKGGPAWVGISLGFSGEGTLHFDDQVTRIHECRQPDGGACELRSPAASTVTATILGGFDFSGFAGEMIVITLPPDA